MEFIGEEIGSPAHTQSPSHLHIEKPVNEDVSCPPEPPAQGAAVPSTAGIKI